MKFSHSDVNDVYFAFFCRIFLSDDDGDSDDDSSKLAVTAAWGIRLGRRGSIGLPTTSKQPSDGKDRIALDISLLKKQYDKLRERQRQAHIILTNTAKQTVNPSSSNSISVNQYLMGRNAIVSSKGKRLGPLQGSIPPARKPAIAKVSKITPKQTYRDETDSIVYPDNKKKIKKNVVALDSLDGHSNYENYSPKKSSSATSIKSSISDTSISTPSKSRKRSESSSYSEDSDANSSTSTSLCDDENFEFSLSSVEASPLKMVHKDVKNVHETQPNIDECIRSLNLYENADGLENGCDEVITIYDQNIVPADCVPYTNDGIESSHQSDDTNDLSVPNTSELTKKNYDDELYGASCSKTWDMNDSFGDTASSTRKKYLKKYEEELFGRCLSPELVRQDSPQFDKNDENSTINSVCEEASDDCSHNQLTVHDPNSLVKQELLIDNPVGITSTSQLSPIVDISKYLGNFTISPLRTPSSFLEYSASDSICQTNAESNDENAFQKYLVSDEGVTNEYFEIVNAPERPTRLDLTQSLSERSPIPDIVMYTNPVEDSATEIVNDPPVHRNASGMQENLSISTASPLVHIKELPDRLNFIREKSYSLDECTKDKEEFRPTSCPESRCDKNNTDRISKIIEENSQILHRILQKKLSGDASITSDELVMMDDINNSATPLDDTLTSVLFKDYDNQETNDAGYVVKDHSDVLDERVGVQADSDKVNAIVPIEPTSFNDNMDDAAQSVDRTVDEEISKNVDEESVKEADDKRVTDVAIDNDSDILKYGLHVPLFEPKPLSLGQNYSNSIVKDIKDPALSETKDLSETLSSIKNTIQNIDSLCQDETRSKSTYSTNKKESSYANYGNKTSSETHSMKGMSYDFAKTDYHLPSRYSRDRSRDVSPRRRLQEDDKKEYESRSRRDLSTTVQHKQKYNTLDISSESKTKDYSTYIPNLTFSLSNYSPAKSNKFEIRHTTVTSTFYDRFMSQKKERSTKLDKSPSTPVITKEYLESLRPPSKDRNSKSAENSPSRSATTTNDSLLLNAYSSTFGTTSIRSCDNIPANLTKSSDLRSHFHFPSKPKKPSELGIKLGMYKH